MKLTDQTRIDVSRILETLDQRLHEVTEEGNCPAMNGEVAALRSLRESAAVLLAVT